MPLNGEEFWNYVKFVNVVSLEIMKNNQCLKFANLIVVNREEFRNI